VAADAGIDCDLQAAEASIHPRDNAIMSEPRLEHQNVKVNPGLKFTSSESNPAYYKANVFRQTRAFGPLTVQMTFGKPVADYLPIPLTSFFDIHYPSAVLALDRKPRGGRRRLIICRQGARFVVNSR
jgi:hypothetical protein